MEFVASRMLGVTVLPAVLDVVVEGSVDGLEVRYVGEDGTQHDARATADDLDVRLPAPTAHSRPSTGPLPASTTARDCQDPLIRHVANDSRGARRQSQR